MLSVIIAANDDPSMLARTLSSVIPAIPEGIVRDGWIIDADNNADIASISDMAGCNHVTGPVLKLLPETAAKCASDWLLLLDAGVILEEGWWRDVAEFLEAISYDKANTASTARFVFARQQYGAWPRFVEWAVAIASYVPFISLRQKALIARRNLVTERAFNAFPPGIGGKPVILRTKAIEPSP
ncbi:MAG: hypothetical protein ACR2O0_12680 [Rhizobiaceae bacterium]